MEPYVRKTEKFARPDFYRTNRANEPNRADFTFRGRPTINTYLYLNRRGASQIQPRVAENRMQPGPHLDNFVFHSTEGKIKQINVPTKEN